MNLVIAFMTTLTTIMPGAAISVINGNIHTIKTAILPIGALPTPVILAKMWIIVYDYIRGEFRKYLRGLIYPRVKDYLVNDFGRSYVFYNSGEACAESIIQYLIIRNPDLWHLNSNSQNANRFLLHKLQNILCGNNYIKAVILK